jgi:hypothetical protein
MCRPFVLAIWVFLSASPSAQASSLFDISLTGVVESATVRALGTFPQPMEVGQPFTVMIKISQLGIGSAVLSVPLPYVMAPSCSGGVSNQAAYSCSNSANQVSYYGPVTYLANGQAEFGSDNLFSFFYNDPEHSSISAGAGIGAFMRADEFGLLSLTLDPTGLSTVPLPPSLPLFFFAVAAFGLLSWRQRKAA